MRCKDIGRINEDQYFFLFIFFKFKVGLCYNFVVCWLGKECFGLVNDVINSKKNLVVN